MSLAARIAAGFLALVGLLGLSSWWQLSVLEELVEHNRRFAEVDSETLTLGMQIWSRLGELQELSQKHEVLRDSRYLDEALRVEAELQRQIDSLASLETSPESAGAITEVVELWAVAGDAAEGEASCSGEKADGEASCSGAK